MRALLGVAAAAVAVVRAQNLALPSLPYEYAALEPYIDEATIQVHHLGHLQAYTDKTNPALAELRTSADTKHLAKLGIDALLKRLSDVPEPQRTALRNNGGGYVNHELYFSQFAPPIEKSGPGGVFNPASDAGAAIVRQFVSFDVFKQLFRAAALKLFGSGWVWLELDARTSSTGGVPVLAITTTANQDTPAMEQGRIPLLGLDVWEHAYYLRYKNVRGDYIDAFWNVVDWSVVDARFSAAVGDRVRSAEAHGRFDAMYPEEPTEL